MLATIFREEVFIDKEKFHLEINLVEQHKTKTMPITLELYFSIWIPCNGTTRVVESYPGKR